MTRAQTPKRKRGVSGGKPAKGICARSEEKFQMEERNKCVRARRI